MIAVVAILGFVMMGLGANSAYISKQEISKHPKTWKGEMLMPPQPTPTAEEK